jgi:phenylpropionate dioxygenase-like ring-hydroxylating dioxygenase large terminal subunit
VLTQEDNELITNTNPGTPLGEVFRRFWLPVALAEELPAPDCVPLRVQVLGEKLIAFRDTSGRVGVLDAYCAHRGAPMFFGRNEEDGLRCVYHGWKYDVDGNCVDLPSAPEGDRFKEQVQIKYYPAVEAGDLVWAYMGPKEKQPPFPEFEWVKLPKSHRYVTKFVESCNYLQAMEGDYDGTHARFLHSVLGAAGIEPDPSGRRGLDAELGRITGPNNRAFASVSNPNEPFPRAVGDRRVTEANALRGKLVDHEQAMLTMNVNQRQDGRFAASVGVSWWMPIFCTAGISAPGHYSSNMRIPIDNQSLMFYRLRWSLTPITHNQLEEYKHGGYSHPDMIPGTWMPRDNIHNDYNIDRVAQRNFSYSGIKTFPLQDIALIEDQRGPIQDRSLEKLVSSDYMIIHVRRRLLEAAKDMQKGIEPSGPWHPEVFRVHRETGIGDTEEEAIANAKEKAFSAQLDSRPELIAAEINV